MLNVENLLMNYQKCLIQRKLEGALNKVVITAGVARLTFDLGMKPQNASKRDPYLVCMYDNEASIYGIPRDIFS